jgi:hypothetical protein
MMNSRDIRTAENLVSNSGSSSTAVSVEEMTRAMAAFTSRRQRDIPDVIVMTHETKNQLMKLEGFPSRPNPAVPQSWYGIPCESYPTRDEASERVAELFQEGKRVVLVCP